jgi:serine protease Do
MRKKHMQNRKIKTLFLAFAMCGALTGATIASLDAREIKPGVNAPYSFADLAEKLSPAVVNVSSTQKVEEDVHMPEMPQFPPGSPFEDFFEEFMDKRGQGGGLGAPALPSASLGSGFIIDAENGYVITNNHVIRDADEVNITLQNDTTIPAEIIGRDEKIDIAVLQVDAKKYKLDAVDFGSSDKMRVGDWILAIGNPFGLGGTVTTGIISARQRDINSGPYDDYIQTDASINRGNSGGPMFDLDGNVIGINTAIFSPTGGSVGIGFAIPSNLAKPVIDQLIKYGRTKRGWLGVRIQTVTDEIAESLGLDKARGALVASITPDGPAEKAKLKAGDVVLKFDGKPVSDMRALPRIVAETPIEKRVILTYWRDGKEQTTEVDIGELEKAEDDGLLAAKEAEEEPIVDKTDSTEIPVIGMSIAKISAATRNSYNVPEDVDGVIISEITARGEADEKGLALGDVIVEINQQGVTEPKDFNDIINKAIKDKKSSVLLLVNRAGDVRFVALKLDSE